MSREQLAQHIRAGAQLLPQIHNNGYFRWGNDSWSEAFGNERRTLTGACALGGGFLSARGNDQISHLKDVDEEILQERVIEFLEKACSVSLKTLIPFDELPSSFQAYHRERYPLQLKRDREDGCMTDGESPAYVLWWVIALLNDALRWPSEHIARWIEKLPSELFSS